MNEKKPLLLRWLPVVIALVLLAGAGAYYVYRLDKWFGYDDEGGYLYASWRIGLGEVPYRDVLTPQLPVFLYPGALVLKLANNSALVTRLWSCALTLGAALWFWLAARRLWGEWAALLALGLVLVQQEMFWAARFYRPEAPMLFWAMLGLYFFVLGYPERRRALLALAGAALGLGMMSKLFGSLPMAGVGLFLLVEGKRSRRWRDMFVTGLTVGLPFAVVVMGIGGVFYALSHDFVADVLGHHLRQGSGTPILIVLKRALRLYYDFCVQQPAYIALAIVGLVRSLRSRRALDTLMACQIPTALVFLGMTRDLQARHLTYLVPAVTGLAAWGLGWIAQWPPARWPVWLRRVIAGVVCVAAVALAVRPQIARNAVVASWEENDTATWTEYIQQHLAPDQYVMSDYPELAFFSQRPTTPIAAGISRGAALSGQITGAALIGEIERDNVQMVLLNVAQGAHQFVLLQDYPQFKQYIQTHFHLAERRTRDSRLMEIYAREDIFPGEIVNHNLGYQLALTGVQWLRGQAAPGENLLVTLRLQALAAMSQDYRLSLRLMDAQGQQWGMGSKKLVDVDKDTYWDERGLERPVPVYTSQWPLAEQSLQTFELPVDLATPPGEYTVICRVHPKNGWDGLPVISPEGHAEGYDVPVGRVTVNRAAQPPDLEQLALERRASTQVAPGARLAGYAPIAVEVRPGDQLGLSLVWQTQAAMSEDYDLIVALHGNDWESRQTYAPARADYPTTQWLPGEVLRGRYAFPVNAELPNGDYALRAWWQDGRGQRVGETCYLGAVRVAGRERLYRVPAIGQPFDVGYGGVITLLGYDLTDPVAAAGGPLRLTLYWRADARMETPYTVFVHLIDAQNRLWGQRDSQPLDGSYPTTAWLPGEVVIDEIELSVQPDAPAGSYQLAVGLYDGATGQRLNAQDTENTPLNENRALLGPVQVTR